MTMNLINVRGVSKTFRLSTGHKLLRDHIRDKFTRRTDDNRFHALRDISFHVGHNEGVALIGSNGAGKSTMLGMIAGVARPDKGIIEVNGRVAALLELGSGFHYDLTGEENIYLNAALLGFSRKRAKQLFEEIVDFSEVSDFIDQPLRVYSTGMVLRLAFSVAITMEPEILITDEVLAVGDAHFQEKCINRIRELREAGMSLLCVSHAPGTVLEMCNRAIWIEQGRMVRDGEASETMAAYLDYINSPDKVLPAPAEPREDVPQLITQATQTPN